MFLTVLLLGGCALLFPSEEGPPKKDQGGQDDPGLDRDGDGISPEAGDCDDADPTVYPGAPELCDDQRNDCLFTWWDDDGRVSFLQDGQGQWQDVTEVFSKGYPGGPGLWRSPYGGTLRLCPGTYYTGVMAQNQALFIEAAGGRDETILSGGERDSVIEGLTAYVEVQGLTLAGGAAEQGGGVRARFSEVVLTDVHILGGQADLGGGIYVNQSELTLRRVTISESQAERGGGLYAESALVVVSESAFSGNQAGDCGGGLLARSWADIIMSDVSMTENQAEFGAGACVEDNGELFYTDGRMADNWADEGGGALLAQRGGGMELARIELEDNLARDGGAIFVTEEGWLEGIDLAIQDNTAERYGGGLVVRDTATASLLGGSFSRNQAAPESRGFGGAAYLRTAAQLTADTVEFTDNSAGDGGAAHVNDGFFGCDFCTFSGHSAEEQGGTISLVDAQLSLDDSSIGDTTAGRLGGAIMATGSVLSITQTALSGGTVERFGGLVYLANSDITGNDLDLLDSHAQQGAGLWMGEASTGQLTWGGLSGLLASSRGGALFLSDTESSLALSGTNFDDNSPDDMDYAGQKYTWGPETSGNCEAGVCTLD